MKQYREGTLTGAKGTGADELGSNRSSIYGLADFLDKADALADEMMDSGPVRADRGRKLRAETDRIRQAIAAGADKSLLYDAIGAGLTYANLCTELRDDTTGPGKITRTDYFREKRRTSTQAELARALDVSERGLRKWEKANLK